MARRGSGEVVLTRRAIYTNPNTPAQRAIAPRLMSPYRGDPNDPYAGDRDPTFSRRLAGQRRREEFADAASQAGNSVRNGRAASPDVEPYYARVRNAAIQGADAQDTKHWAIRRAMANDAEASYRADLDDIREWARMAIEGDWRNAELGLRERAQAIQQEQFGAGMQQEDEQFAARQGLEREQMDRSAIENAQERGARAEEAATGRQFAIDQAAEERAARQSEQMADRAFTADENKKNRKSQRRAIRDRARIDAAKEQTRNRQSNKGVYSGMLPQLGYSSLDGIDDEGKKKSFEDTAAYLAGLPEYQGASDEDIARAAAERMGLGAGGPARATGGAAVGGGVRTAINMANPGAAVANAVVGMFAPTSESRGTAGTTGTEASPYPGARKAKDGRWYVQVNGQWQLVEG